MRAKGKSTMGTCSAAGRGLAVYFLRRILSIERDDTRRTDGRRSLYRTAASFADMQSKFSRLLYQETLPWLLSRLTDEACDGSMKTTAAKSRDCTECAAAIALGTCPRCFSDRRRHADA